MTKIRSVQTCIDNLHWHPTFSEETYVLQRRKQQKTHNNQMCFIYRVIKDDCRGFNNLSYTVHLRQQYIVAPMDQEILEVFFYDVWCAVVMHFSTWSAVDQDAIRLANSFSRYNPMWFLSMGLRQGSGLCSSFHKYSGTEGIIQNRH